MRPPRSARALLAALLPTRVRDAVLDDLECRYPDQKHPRLWYWAQALKTVRPALAYRTEEPHRRIPRKKNQPMESFLQDLKYGLRSLRRSPGFAAVVVLTLAVGIGVNGAIFSVVEQVLLYQLPYAEADRIVQVWGSNEAQGSRRWGTSLHDFEDWRARSETLAEIGVYNLGAANLNYGEVPERVTFAQVSPSLFDVLGTAPALGRTLREEENLPGNDAVVVVSHDFWQEVLAGDEAAVGSSVLLDGTPLLIVGVMPEGFYFPSHDTHLWKPFGMRPDDGGDRGGRWVEAVGRLADGATLAGAQAEMSAIAAAIAAEHPDTNEGFDVFLEPRGSSVVRNSRPIVLVAWTVVALVLLIACANVANLLLSRSTTRAREMAVRASLGAGRVRLLRQQLTESLVLGIAGGAAGVLLASWLTTLLRGLESSGITRLDEVSVTWPVVAYAAALSLLTTALFGLAPALRLSQIDLTRRIKEGTGGAGARRGMREVLVTAQLALSVVVLVGAALLLRTFWNLSAVELGFGVDQRVEARLAPSQIELAERPQAVALYERVAVRLRELPSVTSVGAINAPPLVGGNAWRTRIFAAGRPVESDAQSPSVGYRVVSGDYFEALDIDLVAGRYLDDGDVDGAQPVVVLSRAAAAAIWPQRDALDGELWLVPEGHPAHKRYRVAGIVDDVIDNAPGREPSPLLYFTLVQAQWGHFQDWGMSFVVHTAGDAGTLVEPVRTAIEEVSGGAPVFGVQTLAHRLDGALATSRFNMQMIGYLGAVALALAGLGVYGVMGVMVAQRTREIGTRVALGAGRGQVVRLVAGRGAALAAIGIALGLLAAYAGQGLVAGLLFGIAPTDPLSYAGIAVALLAVSLLASLLPARRAARIDPIVCLRDD